LNVTPENLTTLGIHWDLAAAVDETIRSNGLGYKQIEVGSISLMEHDRFITVGSDCFGC
jgi:hypothetical protein